MAELLQGPLADFYARHPGLATSGFIAVWLVLGVVAWYLLMFYPASNRPGTGAGGPGGIEQRQAVENAPGSVNLQAGRDIVIHPPAARAQAVIGQIVVEVRMTATIKPGAELPPAEVDFWPVGDAHAYLERPPERTRLAFQSPVRFHAQGGSVVTINRFALPEASELRGRPLHAIGNFDTLRVPVVTVVYGQAFERITVLEVSMSVNGEPLWYGTWRYDVAFQVGPVFTIPLGELRQRLARDHAG